MLKSLLPALALGALLAVLPVSGRAEEAYTVIKNGEIPTHVGKGDTFTGTVRREHFFSPTEDAPYGVSRVTFERARAPTGTRTLWGSGSSSPRARDSRARPTARCGRSRPGTLSGARPM